MKHWIATAMVCAALAGTASAADTWITVKPRSPRPGRPLVLCMTSGTTFPKAGSSIDPAGIEQAGWRAKANNGTIDAFDRGDSTLVLHGPDAPEGVTVVWATLRPKEVDLDARQAEAYFDEIGAPESLRRAWEHSGGDGKFHETRTMHMKTFVRAGDAPADRTCLEPVGLMVEFLPDQDPTTLAVGDTLNVRVVKRGYELEGFAVGAVYGADRSSTLLRTNKAGYVRVTITHRGWWMLRGTELRRDGDGTWSSDSTTMTFYAGGTK